MEGDRKRRWRELLVVIFQSTPSAWRETSLPIIWQKTVSFQSTPSAWRETLCRLSYFSSLRHFNPLPPHGGRHECLSISGQGGLFQSTPSAWRETFNRYDAHKFVIYFNPLPPHGGRLPCFGISNPRPNISIHSLRMEGDDLDYNIMRNSTTFQSTPSAWRETNAAIL